MGLSMYNIKKWTKMLTGRSILHVNQGLGRCFSTTGIEGYYNDLTEKVTRAPELLDSNKLPLFPLPDGSEFLFPVGIFQYGLGVWDMYLLTKDPIYRDKFLQCAAWAVENQDTKGRWSTFAPIYPDAPYGAMAQGEGASLLLRAHKLTGHSRYIAAAKLAVDFMLKDLKDGGTALHIAQMQALYELTGKTIFEQYGQLWLRQQKSLPCRTRAFIRKAWQKILER